MRVSERFSQLAGMELCESVNVDTCILNVIIQRFIVKFLTRSSAEVLFNCRRFDIVVETSAIKELLLNFGLELKKLCDVH